MVRYVGGYQSDDETTRRNNCLDERGQRVVGPSSSNASNNLKLQIHRNRSLTGIYSREDFREQYCINDRALQGLEKSRSTGFLFGCLSSYQESPCKKRDNSTSTSFFTSCYGRQPPMENNAYRYDEYRREYDEDGGVMDRGYYAGKTSRYYEFDERGFDKPGTARFVSRESLYEQAKRYTWDEEMHRYVERVDGQYEASGSGMPQQVPPHEDQQPAPAQSAQPRMMVTRYPSAPVSAIESTRKHVSFDNSTLARSITASSFDEHKMKKAMNIVERGQRSAMASSMNISQERLLLDSGRKTPEQIGIVGPSAMMHPPAAVHVPAPVIGSATVIQQYYGGAPAYGIIPPEYMGGKKPLLGTASTSSINSSLMRTQSTQTENFIVRASGPPSYLSLSPRTSYKVRMVSQGAQTNGYLLDSMLKELSSKFSKSIHEINVQTESPAPTARDDLLDLTNEEEFHENVILGLYSTTKNLEHETMSSSSGSYSVFLDENHEHASMLLMKKLLNESPSRVSLPSPSKYTIIKPPEGFRDSNSSVMEEMEKQQQIVQVKPSVFIHQRKKKPSVRAKSEERAVVSDVEERGKARSKTDAATQSSISLHASLHDLTTIDDDDSGIYMEPYTSGIWVYIGENEEIQVWKGQNAPCYATPAHEPLTRTSSGESTLSEREFYKKFTALTHRMVHRKASGEIYRRLRDNTLEINKRVCLSRSEGGEFGFRIHGSRPVVVSAVETNTPAEESGLEVGDVIMSINGVSVLDSSHSDVVRIAKHDLLEMELARTADIIANVCVRDDVIFRGDLWRFKGHYFVVEGEEGEDKSHVEESDSGSGVKRLEMWVKRHFILRTDYCLYYYKIQGNGVQQPLPPASSYFPPLGVIPLSHAHAFLTQPTDEIILLHGASSQQPGSTPSVLYPFELHRTSIIRAQPRVSELILGCESRDERNEWVEVLDQTIRQAVQDDKWVGISGRYVMGPPDSIAFPDCIGVLNKLGRRFKTWTKRFCVLKDACLYVYLSAEEQTALGAAHLHGYRVQTVSSLAVGGKKHAFELIPPTPTSGVQMRHYYLATDSEHDRKRWLAALEYSIDRWINIGEKSSGGVSGGRTTPGSSMCT